MPERPSRRDKKQHADERTVPSATTPSHHIPTHHDGRFLPGAMLGKRYRIVAPLGHGGMGEVYRADDLELGQAVALKLLPAELSVDEGALARLRDEVRVARQISHPNVCRVYDLGEAEGTYFISMEYVDGEDLASLIRRIGRLPAEKGLDIARQLSAGVAAAHTLGVIHRDLKPANIMIDGRGRVRVMDFGLAGFAEELGARRERAGTPQYMAPEQLAGLGVSFRTDVYSLGLVMYELFGGRRPFEADSEAELRGLQQSGPPRKLTEIAVGLDLAVERVIERCLEKDPGGRPSSARAVAAALPGGDPLAAAVAAGETPSPEMVAAAGGSGGLRPQVGAGLFVFVLCGFVAIALLNNRAALFRISALESEPAVMSHRAREILDEMGLTEPPNDVAYGYFANRTVLARVANADSTAARWSSLNELHDTAHYFWYRESPEWMHPYSPRGRVTSRDPPPLSVGMAEVGLTSDGRLRWLMIFHPAAGRDTLELSADWPALIEMAGLDHSDLTEVSSEQDESEDPGGRGPGLPRYVPTDEVRTWEGILPGEPGLPVRVKAASYGGKPALFLVSIGEGGGGAGSDGWAAGSILLVLMILGGPILAWRHLKAGRADRRGAIRLGSLFAVLALVSWAIGTHHTGSLDREFNVLLWNVAMSLLHGCLIGSVYLAMEPYARKYWPDVLISWSRLMGGRFRDPRVGRDVLIGAAAGTLVLVCERFFWLVPAWLGFATWEPEIISASMLKGGRSAVAELLNPDIILSILMWVVPFVVLLALLRRRGLVVVLMLLLMLALFVPDAIGASDSWVAALLCSAVSVSEVVVFLYVFFRFGFLATLAATAFAIHLDIAPITLDASAWYASTSSMVLIVLAGVTLYAFRSAIAHRAMPPGVSSDSWEAPPSSS